MQKIVFDSGIHEYQINDNGVLRFNPSDPNVYARFLDVAEQIKGIEKDLMEKGKSLEAEKNTGEAIIRLMAEADCRTKELLSDVFGAENDFHKILGGVNLLAPATNGERIITNFINALLPIIQEGAERFAQQQIADAQAAAALNREQRRAQQ